MNVQTLKNALGIAAVLLSLQVAGFAQNTPPAPAPSPAPRVEELQQRSEQAKSEQPKVEASQPRGEEQPVTAQEPKTAKRKDLTPVIHFRDF